MWPFRRKRDDDIDLRELRRLAEGRPVSNYVNLLVLDLCRDERAEMVLRQSRPLPIPTRSDDAEYEIPEFRKVANRLKVMAGLDPVTYTEPKEGQIELMVSGKDVTVFLRFEDSCDDPTVRIRAETTSKRS